MFELSILCSGCGLVSIWLVCLLAVGDFVSGLCPFPMFIRATPAVSQNREQKPFLDAKGKKRCSNNRAIA